jgi:hypothetical protein
VLTKKELSKIFAKCAYKLTSILSTSNQYIVVTLYRAEANKVGDARSEPNHSPTLPPPEGRIKLTANPFEMALQMVGPAQRKMIIKWFLCGICLFLCAMLLPLIAGNLLTEGINWLIGCIDGRCGSGNST